MILHGEYEKAAADILVKRSKNKNRSRDHSVLKQYWLSNRKGIRPVKTTASAISKAVKAETTLLCIQLCQV